MRAIGQLPNEAQAQTFGAHLVAHKIRNEIEADGGLWIVWINDEEQVDEAKARLGRFLANPAAPEFQTARAQAAKVKAAEAEDLEQYRQRLRNRRSMFPKFGGYGVGALTYGLIALCVIVAILSKLGYDDEFVRKLVLADPDRADGTFLPEVRAGEYWRLLTPILIHFGPLHLVFNMMWLFQLGCMIEARRGVSTLAALVIVTGTLPMVAQYLVSGPGYVGGMSGAIYGLAGFVWLRGKKDPASGVELDPQSWIIMMIWLVLCMTGAMGRVANTAHLAGLLIGLLWGWVSAYFARRRPE
jgi:GlpG protein